MTDDTEKAEIQAWISMPKTYKTPRPAEKAAIMFAMADYRAAFGAAALEAAYSTVAKGKRGRRWPEENAGRRDRLLQGYLAANAANPNLKVLEFLRSENSPNILPQDEYDHSVEREKEDAKNLRHDLKQWAIWSIGSEPDEDDVCPE